MIQSYAQYKILHLRVYSLATGSFREILPLVPNTQVKFSTGNLKFSCETLFGFVYYPMPPL